MLEDHTMEKKSSGRSSQPPAKGNATDSKKCPDAVGNKIFPRTSRRREPFNPQGTKYEASRKPLPQKNKSIDKRPRPRGLYYGGGMEDTKVAEYEECGEFLNSGFIQGNKKQNLNHLLNFHYAPRERANTGHQSWRPGSGGWGKNTSKWLMTTHKHKYNKEQFLQANCQFVVKSAGNYAAYMENPDMLVDWESIEQVRLRSPELLCPICLYPPVAAKMTRCGHVYCWSCILHYLALSDKSWRKCPICYEAVHKQDLRSAVAIPHAMFSVGEDITLRLMKRKRGSLVALPVSQSEIYSTDKLLSVSETGIDIKYSKLLLASSQEVASIIEKEKCELEAQLAENQDCPEVCFIEQALELLKLRSATCSGEFCHLPYSNEEVASSVATDLFCGKNVDSSCDNLMKEHVTPEDFVDDNSSEKYDPTDFEMHHFNPACFEPGDRVRYESMSSEGLGSEDGVITTEDIDAPGENQFAAGPGTGAPKDFYFYQAADGQHIYLHAVNVRMLEHCYGSLKNCPLTLTGQIVEKESGSMTEELRQRLRYLQHLPVTCQFEVAEISLKPPVVNKGTIEQFRDQLESRKRRRLWRARDERRREKRITEEENRRWGRFPSPHISINSRQQFPSCGIDMENTGSSISESTSSVRSHQGFEEYYSVSTTMENLSMDERPLGDITATASANTEPCGSPSGPSFAQMLREGKSKPQSEWPSVSHERRLLKEPKENVGKFSRSCASDSESEPVGYTPVRSFKQSFSDAITEAMEQAAMTSAISASTKSDLQEISGRAGKKKKKQKQKLLFATGLACKSK